MRGPEGRRIVDRVKAQRYVFERFMRDILGVSAWQANADACKFKHLISAETAERMARFIRFVHAHPEHARGFLAAWREDQEACTREPDACPACQDDCLREVTDIDLKIDP